MATRTCRGCGNEFDRTDRQFRLMSAGEFCSRGCYHASRSKATPDAFYDNTDVLDSGCMVWRGQKNRNGYGRVSVAGRLLAAHRHSWRLNHGDIPSGMHVCHRCDNPPCVNPDHLFVGTAKDNANDKFAKNRGSGKGARPGAQHHNARLTEDVVREIRYRASTGESQKSIRESLGMCSSLVSRIVTRKRWAKVV
jgi:hypothetical protein